MAPLLLGTLLTYAIRFILPPFDKTVNTQLGSRKGIQSYIREVRLAQYKYNFVGILAL